MDFDFISNSTIRLLFLASETRVDTSLSYHGSIEWSCLQHVNANALKSRISITL